MTMRATRKISLVAAAVAVTAGACTGGGGREAGPDAAGRDLGPITLAGSLQPFDACEEFLADVKAQSREVVGAYGLGYGYAVGDGGFFMPDLLGGVARRGEALAASGLDQDDSRGGIAPPAAAPVAGQDFSETNVQEKGIDEPDIVKTNGRLILVASQGELRVIEPGDSPKQIGSVDLPSGGNDQLLLVGDRVLVFGAGHDGVSYRHTLSMPQPQTVVSVVSIERPSEPRLLGSATVDGAFVNARMIDGTARLVVQSGPPRIDWVQPLPGPMGDMGQAGHMEYQRREEAATARNRELLDASTADQWLPKVTDSKGDTRPLVECERIHHPEDPAGVALTTVLSVDRDGKFGEAVSVLASGGTVYASGTGLYVATMQIPPTAAEIAEEAIATQVHRFDISDPDRAYYVGSGGVPGHLLNQFSMSEHEGRLRVATTKGWPGGNGTESLVTILEPKEGALAQVGQVGGLGKTERIYSVRFIGDMGYVVTFRQTDPLYVIDLSDPTAPAVRGELKINGYSAYLHPISDTLLLGVGQDATDEGRRLGMQLSLFDVSDPAAPKRLHQATIADTQSEAEWDHHAFLYWAPTKLSVVPLFDHRRPGASAAGFSVDPQAGIKEIARIEHEPGAEPHMVQIRRSLVIGDRLYTLSDRSLEASSLDTLTETGSLTL